MSRIVPVLKENLHEPSHIIIDTYSGMVEYFIRGKKVDVYEMKDGEKVDVYDNFRPGNYCGYLNQLRQYKNVLSKKNVPFKEEPPKGSGDHTVTKILINQNARL